jgi:primosomal replication protein N
MLQMLLEHRSRQDAELAGDAAGADDDLVFRAPGGGWLTPERFTRVMDELIKESRVRRITPNGLRRAGPMLAHRTPTGGAESR